MNAAAKLELPNIPVMHVIDPVECEESQWKNGLGSTTLINHYPRQSDPSKDEVLWKICEKRVRGDCSLTLSPEYQVGLVALPPANHQQQGNKVELSSAIVRHNDQETLVPLLPLNPHIYDGGLSTVLSLPDVSLTIQNVEDSSSATAGTMDKEFRYISVWAAKKRTEMTVNVETLCQHEFEEECEIIAATARSSDETIDEVASSKIGSAKNMPLSKMLLSHFTILYVMKGAIQVSTGGDQREIRSGKYLIISKNNDILPTDLTLAIARGTEETNAIFLMIQINVNSIESSPSTEFHLPSNKLVRTVTGSLIVYDDQPTLSNETSNAEIDVSGVAPDTSKLSVHHYESARYYHPPHFSSRFKNESQVPPPIVKDSFNINDYPRGTISTAWINMVKQGLSEWIRIPVIVARGVGEGPIVGFTAVMHGNELNGVPCIHRVITDIDVHKLNGTVVAVPCVNVPGYLRFSREFPDGKDLNRQFPGKTNGTPSQIFAYHLLHKLIIHFNYLIDLHTASFGRVNSYYVRADMNDPISAAFAKLQQPQIILHNSGQDGTLRSECMERGIKSITVEIGNPQQFQNQFVQWSYMGAMRILNYLNMFCHTISASSSLAKLHDDSKPNGNGDSILLRSNSSLSNSKLSLAPPPTTILCSKGFWIYTNTGGVLEVYPPVNTIVKKGALIARIKNIFGNIIDEIYCPMTGINIGRSSNPVAMAGDRVLHLGIIKKQREELAKEAKENY